MSFTNSTYNRTALLQIRDILGLPSQVSHGDLVAKVRELKSTADLAGAALLVLQTGSGGTPAATAEQDDEDDLPIGPRRDLAPSVRVPL